MLNKAAGGNDNYYSEVHSGSAKGWSPAFRLGPRRSALGNLPEDESKFPVTTWLKSLLTEGVQQLVLNSLLMRKASPPGQGWEFKPDGSNLPWVIDKLQRSHPAGYDRWIRHLRTDPWRAQTNDLHGATSPVTNMPGNCEWQVDLTPPAAPAVTGDLYKNGSVGCPPVGATSRVSGVTGGPFVWVVGNATGVAPNT